MVCGIQRPTDEIAGELVLHMGKLEGADHPDVEVRPGEVGGRGYSGDRKVAEKTVGAHTSVEVVVQDISAVGTKVQALHQHGNS